MPQFIIYTPCITPRITYVMSVIFKTILGADYVLTSEVEQYESSSLFKINYSQQPIIKTELFLTATDFLLQNKIQKFKIEVKNDTDIPYFFAVDNSGVFPFDLPALAFYLLSRYEEYLPFETDPHDRFMATSSLAHQNGFLNRPIIDEWVLKLRTILLAQYPSANLPFPEYKFQPTYDVDYAWAYRNKSWLFWAGLLNDIRLGRKALFQQRVRVKWKGEKDPYYFFDQYKERHLSLNPRPIFFFLLGNHSAHDKNTRWNHPQMQKLIKALSTDYELGIHPSYASNIKDQQLQKECKRLSSTIKKSVKKSRQHYLKLRFPTTYQNLLDVGIEQDYTMGYADQVGFRASIARAFPWYDLSKEKETSLTIHPFQVMDGTLQKYLKLTAKEAFEVCDELLDQTRKVGGEFITLWHNSSFSPVHGWTADWITGYWALIARGNGI